MGIRINKINAREDVYDITVQNNHNFFANGILVHNCSEILLHSVPTTYSNNNKRKVVEYGETAVCNLGSINLSRHVVNGSIDYNMLADTIKVGSRMLDNVIDINFYPTHEAYLSNSRHRPVGMGSMGWHDAMIQLGIDYGSDESIKLCDNLYEFISLQVIKSNTELAKERGKYSSYEGSTWSQGIMPIDTHVGFINEYRRNVQFDGENITWSEQLSPECKASDFETLPEWKEVREAVAKHGMRNSVTMAIAPNATIARIVGTSPCTEPYYSLIYTESTLSGDFTVINKQFVNDCKEQGIWSSEMISLLKSVDGDIERLASKLPNNEFIQKIVPRYKNAFSVGPKHMIDQAAVRGRWIDQGMSLNIFSDTMSLKTLNNIYMQAWALGLKTTYYLRSKGASNIEKANANISQDAINKLNKSSAAVACSLDNPGGCEMCEG